MLNRTIMFPHTKFSPYIENGTVYERTNSIMVASAKYLGLALRLIGLIHPS